MPSNATTADFSVNKASGVLPMTVIFTDLSRYGPSTPCDGWVWNFGDGGTSTLKNPTHTYTSAGSRTVSLLASYSPDQTAGGQGTKTVDNCISVLNAVQMHTINGNETGVGI
jgi:PKD repeat protein